MSFVTGIYGYTFTRPFNIKGLRFEPLYESHAIASERGRDKKTFRLTGMIFIPVDSLFALRRWTQTLFDLEAALSFCEQQRVALSNCVELTTGEDARSILLAEEPHEVKDALPLELIVSDSLTRRHPRPSYGACLQFDAFEPDMRLRFLELIMTKFSDEAFQATSGFRSAFFRNIEMLKMVEAPVDVTYSLLFTGLELLARKNLRSIPTACPGS
jgi:hypothetical protein